MAGGNFLSTAYGPPWNAMNGSGVTSTGVPLRGQVPIIAVDPNVIPYGSIVRASNSPLGPNRLFVAGDTGGAIKGNHIDFYVASGRPAQMGWGSQQIQLQVVKPGSGPGSVHSALAQLGGMGSPAPSSLNVPPVTTGTLPSLSVQIPTFDQAGFDKAQKGYVLGSFLSHQKSPFDQKGFKIDTGPSALGALFQKGVLSSRPPDPQQFQGTKTVQIAHQQLQQIAGTKLSVPSMLRAGTVAGGFLPQGAHYIPGRKDQGRDGQTNPGGPIVANGNGVVVAVKSDPNGFGPSYPIVRFSSGPYAGRTLYFGHTLSAVRPGQRVQAGQVISHTGTHGVGNASVAGWFEVGFADSGSPGPLGQPAPF